MIARLVRWWIVFFAAWALRHGMPPVDMLGVLTKSFPRQDPAWRLAVLTDAERRNTAAAGG